MNRKDRPCLLCTCFDSQTIELDEIGRALAPEGRLKKVAELCRRDVGCFRELAESGEPFTVACEQEAPLFSALAPQSDVRFVDIRDSAGWSSAGGSKAPKMAALLAAAAIEAPPPESLQVVSNGHCVVIGSGQPALDCAMTLADRLDVTLVLRGDADGIVLPSAKGVDILVAGVTRLKGSLGAFRLELDDATRIAPNSRDTLCLEPAENRLACDIVFDLSNDMPLVIAPEKRSGYIQVDPDDPVRVHSAMLSLTELVGTFEKTRYIHLEPAACIHSRDGTTGCTLCLVNCPTSAIRPDGEHVSIDPMICAGCGSCSALCPTGAASYAAPATDVLVARLEELLGVYLDAGGLGPVLLVHEVDHGRELISALARYGDGLPANVLPFDAGELGRIGLDLMLSAFAIGAKRLIFLAATAKAGDLIALETGLTQATSILEGLGYGRDRLRLLVEDDPERLARDFDESRAGAECSMPRGAMSGCSGKRERMWMAIDQLAAPDRTDMPVKRSPLCPDAVRSDRDRGERCALACARTCPTGALIGDAKRQRSASEKRPAFRSVPQGLPRRNRHPRTTPRMVR
ncbi:MAG: 4Fe-4S dicluster domain-containing protein [Geminicoccaceae bacterium]